MRLKQLLALTALNVNTFKARSRPRVISPGDKRIGIREKTANQLPLRRFTTDDEDESSEFAPFDSYLIVLGDGLVMSGAGLSDAADFLRTLIQDIIAQEWKSVTEANANLFVGYAMAERTGDERGYGWEQISLFGTLEDIASGHKYALYPSVNVLPVGRTVGLIVANASLAWRTIEDRARDHNIDITKVF